MKHIKNFVPQHVPNSMSLTAPAIKASFEESGIYPFEGFSKAIFQDEIRGAYSLFSITRFGQTRNIPSSERRYGVFRKVLTTIESTKADVAKVQNLTNFLHSADTWTNILCRTIAPLDIEKDLPQGNGDKVTLKAYDCGMSA